ncbi:MAG: exodeoxyribonuclease VII large subunit, partial [Bacteroidia bacterium]
NFESVTAQQFTNGIQVLAQVRVEFHSIHGFSLILVDIDPSFTLGNLEKQRRETLLKLVELNPSFISKVGEEFVTRNKQLTLKSVIQKIALIASPNSEGYNDFIHTMKNNQFGYKFHIDEYRSSVQGALAEAELVNTLIKIYNAQIDYDCIVIVRGGGAKTDFLVFDTYKVAQAVAKFPIPVITGLGHHKDVSIADLMAHTVTKTPTKSAEFIISQNRVFEDALIQLQKRVIIRSQQMLNNASQNVNAANIIIINTSRTLLAHYKDQLTSFNQVVINKTKTILYNRQTNLVALLNQILSRPKIVTSNKRADLNNIIGNLKSFSGKYLVNSRGYLNHYNSIVKLMSPKNILKKGFAIISQNDKILKDASAIEAGATLKITMSDFDLNTKVISKTKNDGRETDI